MITQALRGPHTLYRRYHAFVESAITSISLAVLVCLTLYNLPAYPQNWILVIGVAIAVLGARWPLAAYFLAVTALIYPIYTINLYLAVIFVAVSVLGCRLFVHYMGATLLVLATPVLARYHLHWLVPILGGLWWGGISGAWIGGLAALWGKVLGGMVGMNTDWLLLAGHTPDTQVMMTRFHEANSLNTLLLLVEPFAAPSGVILYNLLQVAGWAVAGALVGSLAWRKWVKYRTPWSILVLTAGGGLIMFATHLGLPYWLKEAVTANTVKALQDPSGPLFALLMVIIIGTTVHSFRESLDLPAALPRSSRVVYKNKNKSSFNLFRRQQGQVNQPKPNSAKAASPELDRPRRPVRVPQQNELPEWEPPRDESGLIMLEID